MKLVNCSVNNAKISASYSYGGLVGSLYDSALFDGCSTDGIALSINDNPYIYGYVLNFIGDIANNKTSYARTVEINNCKSSDLSEATKSDLLFGQVISRMKALGYATGAGSYLNGTQYVGGHPYFGMVEPIKEVIEGSGNFKKLVIKVDGKTLVNGTDFNVCK